MKKLFFTAAALSVGFLAFAQEATQNTIVQSNEYKIVNKIKLEGDMGWDYISVDDSTNMLYVSHGDRVHVIDLNNNNKVVGTINDLHGVHGIAFSDELNKGFISCGKDSSVLVFDLKTYQTIAKIKVTGANPDAIVYDPFTKKVFTFNGRSSNSTVIDATLNTVIGTIVLPGKPEFAVSDGKGKIYDNLEDKSEICVIDTRGLKVLDVWPLKPADGPSGLAIDTKTNNLFSVCDKMMVVVDINTGKATKFLPIGGDPDAAGFDNVLSRAYSSNSDGTLSVYQQTGKDTFTSLGSVMTQKRARTCCVNSKTHHIYLSVADLGETPAPTADKPHPKPSLKPGTFTVLDVQYLK